MVHVVQTLRASHCKSASDFLLCFVTLIFRGPFNWPHRTKPPTRATLLSSAETFGDTHPERERERESERDRPWLSPKKERTLSTSLSLLNKPSAMMKSWMAMKKVANLDVELSVEERNLLSVGYKNVVGARRASWRILSSIEQKEEAKGNDRNVKRIKEYRHKVESELSNVCNEIMSVIDEHLIPSCSAEESTVFFYKMKGDYFRYLAEFKSGDES